LKEFLIELKRLYPNAKIYGHRDFAAKACPSFDAKAEYSSL
jgi:N-acetylmuramoyl-L-alanine amidase